MFFSSSFRIQSQGFSDVINITDRVAAVCAESGIKNGIALIFVTGSTAGITTIEYEDGAIRDFKEAVERLVPSNTPYHHDSRWGDGNGFSHIRASLLGPELAVPLADGRLALGIWQHIVLCDFDNKVRERTVLAHVVGV